MKQIDKREIAGFDAAVAAAVAALPRLQPLVATDDVGIPRVVFDDSGQLVMVEVPS